MATYLPVQINTIQLVLVHKLDHLVSKGISARVVNGLGTEVIIKIPSTESTDGVSDCQDLVAYAVNLTFAKWGLALRVVTSGTALTEVSIARLNELTKGVHRLHIDEGFC